MDVQLLRIALVGRANIRADNHRSADVLREEILLRATASPGCTGLHNLRTRIMQRAVECSGLEVRAKRDFARALTRRFSFSRAGDHKSSGVCVRT